MYLSELLAGLARRWWLVATGLVATVALSVFAYILVPAEQEIHASVLVLPPETATEEAHNPFLALNGLQPAADVLARAMNGGEVQEDLTPTDGSAEYEVARDVTSSGPVLIVGVTGRTEQAAAGLLDAVLVRMPEVFADLQADVDVPRSSTMTLTQVARETEPTASNKSQVRAVLVAAVGGLAATIFGTNLIDGLILRRRAHQAGRRRQASQHPDPTRPTQADSPAQPRTPALRRDVDNADATVTSAIAVGDLPRQFAGMPRVRGGADLPEDSSDT